MQRRNTPLVFPSRFYSPWCSFSVRTQDTSSRLQCFDQYSWSGSTCTVTKEIKLWDRPKAEKETREQKEGTRTYHCCIQTTQHGRPVFTSRGAQHLIPLVHIFPKDMALAHEVWLMIDHACSPSYVRHVGGWCPDENCLMMRFKIMRKTSLL